MKDEAQKFYDEAIAQAGAVYAEEKALAEETVRKLISKAEEVCYKRLKKLAENYHKVVTKAERLHKARGIRGAMDVYIEQECPYCYGLLEIPSVEAIEEWLEENEQ